MRRLVGMLAIGLVALATGAYAAVGAPVGFWRATNDCFLAVFLLGENGHAQAAYTSGEQEQKRYVDLARHPPSDHRSQRSLRARIDGTDPANDRVEAEYVWHDLDKDQLNRQSCVFEHVEAKRL